MACPVFLALGMCSNSQSFTDAGACQLRPEAIRMLAKLDNFIRIQIDSGSSARKVVYLQSCKTLAPPNSFFYDFTAGAYHYGKRRTVQDTGKKNADGGLVFAHREGEVAWEDDNSIVRPGVLCLSTELDGLLCGSGTGPNENGGLFVATSIQCFSGRLYRGRSLRV